MINTTRDSLKISLIQARNLEQQPQESFCQKMFNNCFLIPFFRKKHENYKNDDTGFSISHSFDEKMAENSLEIKYSPNKNFSQPSQKSFFSQYKVENFPENEIFVLEGEITKNPVLMKVTEKRFYSNIEKNKAFLGVSNIIPNYFAHNKDLANEKIAKQLNKLPFCFPKYEEIKYSIDYLSECDLPNRCFSEYLSEKLRGNLVMDFTGGIGEYLFPVNF